ncbi:hypothetical protein VBY74_08495 [Tenacibaculum ascidiaceicola]|uniref:hypothetical protein n=1 Tax=Tenacibaculum ascidiaceicola TaxID=1699411 RepID=UPI0039E8702D
MKQNKETLKQFFETGDKPTQQQYSDLIDSYIDAKQPEGEANRRFVIDETGEVSVASEQQVPEYTLSPISGTNTVDLLKDGVSVSQIDLTPYLDNTNLARLVSGTVDTNGLATFTRDDNSTFTVDLSNLKDSPTLQQVTDRDNITSNDLVLRDLNSNSNQKIVFETLGDNYSFEQTSVDQEGQSITEFFLKRNNLDVMKFHSDSGAPLQGFTTLETPLTIKGNSLYGLNIVSPNGIKSFRMKVPDTNTDNVSILNVPDGDGTISRLEDIPQIQAGSNITIDNTDPLQPIINASGGSMSITEGSFTPTFITNGSSFSATVYGADYYIIGDRVFADIELRNVSSDGQASGGNIEVSFSGISSLVARHGAVGSVFNKTTKESYNCMIDWNSNKILVPDNVLSSGELLLSINYKQGAQSV